MLTHYLIPVDTQSQYPFCDCRVTLLNTREKTMKTSKKTIKKHAMRTALATAIVGSISSQTAIAFEFVDAMTSGDGYVNFNLRYESADQDNALEDASSLTLRTLLGYETGRYHGFSGKIEMEDSRIVMGQGDYTVGPTGYNVGQYSVIADPETTELEQGYIQYKNDVFSAKLGRQYITFDGHRFIGHVGWRQDWQSFDAFSTKYTPNEDLTLSYAYINQRNRIFAEEANVDSKDHLLNASYKTEYGKLVAYSYLLEEDNNTNKIIDTYGFSFTGDTKAGNTKILYAAEYATQTQETGTTEFDADYLNLQAEAVISGITAKVGYEVLGSDDGASGFAVPLSTLHKFNGWSDQFLATPVEGLVDTTFTLSGGLLNGVWTAVYHQFNADDASETVDDLGTEINLQYVKKYGKHYTAAIKYAAFSAADIKVDDNNLWVWLGAKF